MARRLAKLLPSSSKVFNLEGSIFKWVAENKPLVDSSGAQVAVVHPYSDLWGKLLAQENRAPLQ